MTRKILAVLLSALTLLAVTACSSGAPVCSEHAVQNPLDEPMDFSLKRDVSVCITQSAFITDYEKNWLTEVVEDGFNCDLHMSVLPAGDNGLAKLQLMVNSGERLPDVFSCRIPDTLIYQYGSGGTFVPLNDYYKSENIMPYFNAIESEDDKTSMIEAATSADGRLYSLTRFEPDNWSATPYRTYINAVWLDNLGLEKPETTDELRDVLQAFREQDPNGNGRQDEIPLLANYVDSGNFGSNVLLYLINSFVYVPTEMSALTVSADGRTVVAPQVSEGWREAMAYLHSLYDVGAILPEGSFVYGDDPTGYAALLNDRSNGSEKAPKGKSVNVVGLFSAGSQSAYFPGSGTDENEHFLETELLPPMKNGSREGYSPYRVYRPLPYWFVTSDAEEPAFCTMVGDYFYDPAMSICARFGIEDEDWTDDTKICETWYKDYTEILEKYKYTGVRQTRLDYQYVAGVGDINLWVEGNNHFWYNEQPRYRSLDTLNHHEGSFFVPEEERDSYRMNRNSILQVLNYEYYAHAHPKFGLPQLMYTVEEQESIAEFRLLYPEEILSATMQFITGELSVETDWDTYVDRLNGLGLENYLRVSQAAYERSVYYRANFV